jgi:adenylosuccinate synthase
MASRQSKPIIVVQGAQWGSEAKGAIAAALCEQRSVTHAVRTGTVNAGHTVIYNGETFKMQQLPTGWTAPDIPELYIGPGAYIYPEILAREIKWIREALGRQPGIFIDSRCGLHLPIHTERSTKSGRHHSMGATGKGCSEAVIDKIQRRGSGGRLFADWMNLEWNEIQRGAGEHWTNELRDIQLVDVPDMLNDDWDTGAQILVEGTQGTMLDLHLGPYPYTTHKQTQCGNWLAEAGLSPALPIEVCLVARTFPIRVAGNSGPMPMETSWVELARDINGRLAEFDLSPRVQYDSLIQFEDACATAGSVLARQGMLPGEWETLGWRVERWPQEQREQYPAFISELHKTALDMLPGVVVDDLKKIFEMTTVTNKLRRVAELDPVTLKTSIRLNRPKYLAVTFMNYLFPEIWDGDWDDMKAKSLNDIGDWITNMEQILGTEIRYISTGAETNRVLEVEE